MHAKGLIRQALLCYFAYTPPNNGHLELFVVSNMPSHPSVSQVCMPSRARWTTGLHLFLSVFLMFTLFVGLSGTVRGEWIELPVAAPDAETAVVRGLDRALLRLTGFRSDAAQALMMEMLADDQQPWLHSIERRGENEYRVALARNLLWSRLRESGVPVWAGTRPSLLVWVVLDSQDRRQLLSSGMDPDGILPVLTAWASERDFSLLWPLGDLVDRRDVRIADIIGGVTEGLQPPSARYSPDGIVLLHVIDRLSGPEARVWITYQGREVRGEGLGVDLGDATVRAMGRALDALGSGMATVLRPEESIRIGFTRIDSHARLRRLRDRLEEIDVIAAARPALVLPGAVVMDLQSGLDRSRLEELLQAEGFILIDGPAVARIEPAFWLRSLW